MPDPENDSKPADEPRRRPSHFRKKRRDPTTQVVRVAQRRVRNSPDPGDTEDDTHALQGPNGGPGFPDPPLERPAPPPAPLPSEGSPREPPVSGWLDGRHRRKRAENIIGTVGLALMVAAMLVAMWLRMTGP